MPMVFKTVIVHENLAAALRAKELADRLVSAFKLDVSADIDYWKFDWLNWSPFREQAAAAAIAADIVIYSTVNDGMPPLSIQTWTESWLPDKHNTWSALVLLVGGGHPAAMDSRRLSRYLHGLAADARMDFFCNVTDKPNQVERLAVDSIRWQAQNRLLAREVPVYSRAPADRRNQVSGH
jgi:hypothetical protein